jgi:L-fucose isomerase-like protein
VIFYIGLGVKHGPIAQYRRPGVYFIQSLDNFEALEYGLRMLNAKKRMSQSRLLSITEADAPREGVEAFLGATVKVIPFASYADEFQAVTLHDEARQLIAQFTGGAKEIRGVTPEALENAARAHFALKKLLADENADGLSMNCLRRGMLKPCMSFATLNSQLIPAACENDLPALYTQLLGQLLTGRPGFQHNPCYETERNHYYASHCTCATKLYGPDGPDVPYLLRRFAHTNEGSCAIQVFWKPDDPVTMVRYYPGTPPTLDVYAGKVVASHPMPPAAGCTTNVEIEVSDRADACLVQGHHNLLFCGDFARKFRLFAQLYKLKLAATGGPRPEESYDIKSDV